MYRNLGRNKGYEFNPNDSLSDTYPSTISNDGSDTDLLTKKYMEASTATTSNPRVVRSVLYQLSSFGNNTVVNPLQLPSNIKIDCVATNGSSHFLAVTSGNEINLLDTSYKRCYNYFQVELYIHGEKEVQV